jgi:signal transduction histidine kinase
MTTADLELIPPARPPSFAARFEDTGRRQSIAGMVGVGAALVTLYALGALLPFWFLDAPEVGAAFFPAAGLTFTVFLLSPTRTWPVWALLIAATELAIDVSHGLSVSAGLGFALANTVEPMVGAAGVRATAGLPGSTLRHRLVSFTVWGLIVGPAVGAAIGATSSLLTAGGEHWFATAVRWWLGDTLGVLIVGSFLLVLTVPLPFDGRVGWLETTAIVTLATGLALVPAILWQRPMIYAVLPILMWAALRGGCRTVSFAGVGLAFAANWAVVTGRADALFVAADPHDRLMYVQVLLGLSLLAAFWLAVEVADRRRVEYAMKLADEDRLRSEHAAVELAEAERRRIARETHGIVGHALNVMLLHAGAARRVLPTDGGQALEFLESIETVGRRAFGDLDVALSLANAIPDAKPGRGLSSLPELVEVMRQGGLQVTLEVVGERKDVSTLVDWSAYRIVEEALTNVAKHAPSAVASVSIVYDSEAVSIAVVDDGASFHAPRDERPGRGLIGMRERVAVLGGTINTGRDGHGFAVRARLPLKGAGA